MLHGLSRKSCPDFAVVVPRPYGLYGPLNVAFCLGKRAAIRPAQKIKCCRTKSVPYRFISPAGYLEIHAQLLPWKSCHFFATNPSSENWKLLLLLLSLNLSISPRKNDFSFGLFPPLESLSDF
jgi:hypothetical protein